MSSNTLQYPRLAYSTPLPSDGLRQEIVRYTLPATKALPFVKAPPEDQPLRRPESYWRVEPTENRNHDRELGRQYAQVAIAAMKADRNAHLIADIIQDMMAGAIERAGKAGKPNRNAIVLGFLTELSETLSKS